MFRIRPFEEKDAELLCPTAVDDNLHGNEQHWKKWAKLNKEAGPAYTALYEGRPIIAGGIRLLENNMGWVWTVFSPLAKQHKLTAFRSVKTMISILMDEFKFTSLVTESRKGFDASQRLLEHLGFKRMEEETAVFYFYKLERSR